ncbi:hypothetical protein Tsubulata_024641 [Turnera subulata]|uniref:Uncharacterized protein n=1 Tax=Turnera subulata TaxID=218843 RepID=A0A9Q0FW06_9ROSI|nr:hypothetical protein Tsubulata_024641 [Turnera subulata]
MLHYIYVYVHADLDSPGPKVAKGVDVLEEYANALRTESYNEFWTRVQAFCNPTPDSATATSPSPSPSTSSARLPSYRLFAEHLLDPDQLSVMRLLNRVHDPSTFTHSLLSKYFTQTADASLLCGLLLKNMDRVRAKYCSLKATLRAQYSMIHASLAQTANTLNQFARPILCALRVRDMQADCSTLLGQLESRRDRAKAELQLKNKIKHCSATFLVALTASLTIIVATHALALLVAGPSLMIIDHMKKKLRRGRKRSLAKEWGELDAAAKGTYILSRDLDTISRLVGRLGDELEDVHATVKHWVLERGPKDWHGNPQVFRLLNNNNNDDAFIRQLDELEEHLYLCFMTINRSRNLVLQEILHSNLSNSSDHPNMFSI